MAGGSMAVRRRAREWRTAEVIRGRHVNGARSSTKFQQSCIFLHDFTKPSHRA
jgi:hypothetical protein